MINWNKIRPLRRTFAAKTAATEQERQKLNLDALTSEYMTSHLYLVQEPFPEHPTQKHISHTFRTKLEADLWIVQKQEAA